MREDENVIEKKRCGNADGCDDQEPQSRPGANQDFDYSVLTNHEMYICIEICTMLMDIVKMRQCFRFRKVPHRRPNNASPSLLVQTSVHQGRHDNSYTLSPTQLLLAPDLNPSASKKTGR